MTPLGLYWDSGEDDKPAIGLTDRQHRDEETHRQNAYANLLSHDHLLLNLGVTNLLAVAR